MKILRKGEWGQTPCYGVWLYDNALGLDALEQIECAGHPRDSETGGPDLEKAGLCFFKKASFWFRWPEGESRSRGAVETLLKALREKYFPEGEGWDYFSHNLEFFPDYKGMVEDYQCPDCPVIATALKVGRKKESPEFTPAEIESLREKAEVMAREVFSLLTK